MTGIDQFDWSQGDPDYDKVFHEEQTVDDVSETIALAMKDRGVSRSELATSVGVTKSAITQRFRGANITIRKLAQTLYALGFQLEVALIDLRIPDRRLQLRNYLREQNWPSLLLHPSLKESTWTRHAADAQQREEQPDVSLWG
ncbi:Putative uncharacterized protein [Propionibacterium freudenreichii]|uniref:helix-turn-helix domain-containing protein n=1 Tax=Propionibacterium freudenreichii TaxID=1744 RepID=UPI00054196B7|nr:helix-turn-helix domain-containing protein [Propionibacterium freudenreichii]CEG89027.1 Putative uncharacterized protein [Propionibacterium freudenreichii]